MDCMQYSTISYLWFHTICTFFHFTFWNAIIDSFIWLKVTAANKKNNGYFSTECVGFLYVMTYYKEPCVYTAFIVCFIFPQFSASRVSVSFAVAYVLCLSDEPVLYSSSSKSKNISSWVTILIKNCVILVIHTNKKFLYVSNMYLSNTYLMECSHDIYFFLNSVQLVSILEYIQV